MQFTYTVPVVRKFVAVAVEKIVLLLPVSANCPEVPNANVLDVAPIELNNPQVKVKLFKSSVPLVRVAVLVDPIVNALRSCQLPPTPENVTGASMVIPLVDIVFAVVALKVTTPVELHAVPAIIDIDPDTARVGDVPAAKVTVPADTVMFKQSKAPVIVTV